MSNRPLCRHCGKPIAKATNVMFVHDPGVASMHGVVEGPLHNKAECQRTTNQEVISVSYSEYNGVRRVWKFATWDRVSFVSEFFCKDACAVRFAYLLAKGGHCTKAYNTAVARQNELQQK